MTAENRPEEPEWQFVVDKSLNGAEEEDQYSDWFWVDNPEESVDTDHDINDRTCRARAEASARLPCKSPAREKLQPGAAQMKPPATDVNPPDVDLGGDEDWVPPATSTPPKKEPVEWLFYTECGNHARARRRRKAGEFPLPKPRWPASSRGSQPCNPRP